MQTAMDAFRELPPLLILAFTFLLPAAASSVMFGMFVPAQTAIILAGVAAHEEAVPVWAVILAATAGALIGNHVGYRAGQRTGQPMEQRLAPRWADQLDRVLRFVRRRGALAVIIGRWNAVFRPLVPRVCGMSGMSSRTFTIGNVIGGSIWAALCSALGYLVGNGYEHLERRLTVTGEITLGTVVLVVVLVLLVQHYRSTRRGRR